MIVLTGASGFVWLQLVSRLPPDEKVLLVSRDAAALRARFPSAEVCDYAALEQCDLPGAVVIQLAALNNQQLGTRSECPADNVIHLLETPATVKKGGPVCFFSF